MFGPFIGSISRSNLFLLKQKKIPINATVRSKIFSRIIVQIVHQVKINNSKDFLGLLLVVIMLCQEGKFESVTLAVILWEKIYHSCKPFFLKNIRVELQILAFQMFLYSRFYLLINVAIVAKTR